MANRSDHTGHSAVGKTVARAFAEFFDFGRAGKPEAIAYRSWSLGLRKGSKALS
jgi:hypothetical protein